jgi:IS5 family transposase
LRLVLSWRSMTDRLTAKDAIYMVHTTKSIGNDFPRYICLFYAYCSYRPLVCTREAQPSWRLLRSLAKNPET